MTDWDALIENGTINDLYWAAEEALNNEEPIPVDVEARLREAGMWV